MSESAPSSLFCLNSWGLGIQRWKSHRWQRPGFSSLSFQWCYWAMFAVPSQNCSHRWLSTVVTLPGVFGGFHSLCWILRECPGPENFSVQEMVSNLCFGSCIFPWPSPSFKRPSLKLPTQLHDFMASAFPLLVVMAVIIGRFFQLLECLPVFCSHAFTFQDQICLQNVPFYNYNSLSVYRGKINI